MHFDAHDGVMLAAAPGEGQDTSCLTVEQVLATGLSVGRADRVPAPEVKAAGVEVEVGLVNDHVAGCFRYRC